MTVRFSPRSLRLRAKFLFLVCGCPCLPAETLQEVLRDAGIPTRQFSAPDLAAKITSYAIANNDPFLLAYYVDTGTGLLGPPLRLIRFDRAKRDLRRADFADIHALFQRDVPMSCLGSALDIREYRGNIYIDTHANPSAGCVIVLSSTLSFKTAISGWLLGLIAADYAIVRHSEIHFMSVHPMHIGVLDLEQNHLVEVFPFENDPQRREFSGLLKPHIVEKWCKEHNAQCDPENFDTDLKGKLAVNEAARIFGFEAEFNASGFGEATEKQVPRRNVVYVFRQRSGEWEHREFPVAQFRSLFSGKNLQELISSEPNRAFAVTFPAP